MNLYVEKVRLELEDDQMDGLLSELQELGVPVGSCGGPLPMLAALHLILCQVTGDLNGN